MKTVLTIAGSDCSGGAGIQADLKTMLTNNVFGMSVITAITAQNTVGVQGILDLPPEIIAQQMDSVFSDIFPDAVKIGMVSNHEIIKILSKKLKYYNAKNIVIDPVMVATSKGNLIDKNSVNCLVDELFPLATLITPNLYEAEILSGIKIESRKDMEKVGKILFEKNNCAVLIKGGHLTSSASDYLIDKNHSTWFEAQLIDNKNTHGTGCTLSSAIASNLAKGLSLDKAVRKAKEYVTLAINAKLNLGHGRGPLNHKV